MNWVIRNSSKISYHTNLSEIMKPLLPFIHEYTWLVTEVDYLFFDEGDHPFNFDDDYFLLSGEEFASVIERSAQFIWGVFTGIPAHKTLSIDIGNLPFADRNKKLWTNGSLQHPAAEVEIIAFDSTYTIAKFKREDMSAAFVGYFAEALRLDEFCD